MIEHTTRRIRILGATTDPTAAFAPGSGKGHEFSERSAFGSSRPVAVMFHHLGASLNVFTDGS